MISLMDIIFGISIFMFGIFVAILWIQIAEKINERKRHKKELEEETIRLENDGWVRIDNVFPDGYNRKSMLSWYSEQKRKIEICEWIEKNTTGDFEKRQQFGHVYVKFADPDDGMAFKLRWV